MHKKFLYMSNIWHSIYFLTLRLLLRNFALWNFLFTNPKYKILYLTTWLTQYVLTFLTCILENNRTIKNHVKREHDTTNCTERERERVQPKGMNGRGLISERWKVSMHTGSSLRRLITSDTAHCRGLLFLQALPKRRNLISSSFFFLLFSLPLFRNCPKLWRNFYLWNFPAAGE